MFVLPHHCITIEIQAVLPMISLVYIHQSLLNSAGAANPLIPLPPYCLVRLTLSIDFLNTIFTTATLLYYVMDSDSGVAALHLVARGTTIQF